MKQVASLALAGLLCILSGCAAAPRVGAHAGGARFTVSLPDVKLEPLEYIQEAQVTVCHGRIVSINLLVYDWHYEIAWDGGSKVTITGEAGHFSSGLSDTKELTDFITVEPFGDSPTHVTARIHTSSCDPPGRPDRELVVRAGEMIYKSVRNHEAHETKH